MRAVRIEPFTETDIPQAVQLTIEAWAEALADWDKTVAAVVCEYSVRDEFLNKNLSLKITDNGNMKGFIFAALPGDENDADTWLENQKRRFENKEHLDILQMVKGVSRRNEDLVLKNMGRNDAMLTFFLSIQKGCGKQLLSAMTEKLVTMKIENSLLWTDVTCNHQYYPKHGFELVDKTDYASHDDEEPFTVFIYKKNIIRS